MRACLEIQAIEQAKKNVAHGFEEPQDSEPDDKPESLDHLENETQRAEFLRVDGQLLLFGILRHLGTD